MRRAAYSNPVDEAPLSVSYRCVCGEEVSLDLHSGGQCGACRRRYSPEVARLAATETIQMPRALEEAIEIDEDTEPKAGVLVKDEPTGAVTTIVDQDGELRPEVGLPADRRLGHFRIVGRLGRGGMGDVFRALDESLERYVALKVLRPSAGEGNGGVAGAKLLLQEARAQARVNHPGVVHIYFVSPDPQRPFLAMELVPGPTLADRLKSGPLPYAETIDFALQIARALKHAARFDVVHGDIKPGNILLAGDGGVKLSDFGLARRLSNKASSPSGPITGTPHYLPPEVLAGSDPDIRGDMYALGVMLFEMTFGRRPYTIETGKLRDAIEAHRSAPVEFPDPWPVDLPESWKLIVSKLLEKSPEDRYQSHDELILDLERVQPVDLPRAGRFTRGVAWLVDLFLASAARGVFMLPFAIDDTWRDLGHEPILRLSLTMFSGLPLLGAAWLQGVWKTSPGKALMQLRIVDRYGLTPNPAILAARVTLQLLIVWGAVIANVFSLGLKAEPLGVLVTSGALAVTIVDAAFALIRRDGRSLHDLLFRTRVVLDTRKEDEPV